MLNSSASYKYPEAWYSVSWSTQIPINNNITDASMNNYTILLTSGLNNPVCLQPFRQSKQTQVNQD